MPFHLSIDYIIYGVHVHLVTDPGDELLVDNVSEQDVAAEHNGHGDVDDEVERGFLKLKVVETPETKPQVTSHVDYCCEQEHDAD